jgi:hypothetical protein
MAAKRRAKNSELAKIYRVVRETVPNLLSALECCRTLSTSSFIRDSESNSRKWMIESFADAWTTMYQPRQAYRNVLEPATFRLTLQFMISKQLIPEAIFTNLAPQGRSLRGLIIDWTYKLPMQSHQYRTRMTRL